MKCIILFFKTPLLRTSNELVIDFIKGLLGSDIKYTINEQNIVVYFRNEEEVDFKAISYMMINDFSLDLTLYESTVVESIKEDYINHIINSFEKIDIATNYINEKQFIVNQSITHLEIIKKNVLKEYFYDSEMLNIIKVYLENNLNTSLAATKLYLHRNTLINKIDKFINITGYDVKTFKDAFVVYQLLI